MPNPTPHAMCHCLACYNVITANMKELTADLHEANEREAIASSAFAEVKADYEMLATEARRVGPDGYDPIACIQQRDKHVVELEEKATALRARAQSLAAALDRTERCNKNQAVEGQEKDRRIKTLHADLERVTGQRDEAEYHIGERIDVVKGLERELDKARAHSEAMEWQHEQANKRIATLEAALRDAVKWLTGTPQGRAIPQLHGEPGMWLSAATRALTPEPDQPAEPQADSGEEGEPDECFCTECQSGAAGLDPDPNGETD